MIARNLRRFLLAASAAFVVSLCAAQASNAQGFKVEYRRIPWNTQHFNDANQAKAYADTLQQLGCEVVQEPHNGHIDVRYRCFGWRQITVQNHDVCHQWEAWLKSNGFETKHQH